MSQVNELAVEEIIQDFSWQSIRYYFFLLEYIEESEKIEIAKNVHRRDIERIWSDTNLSRAIYHFWDGRAVSGISCQ